MSWPFFFFFAFFNFFVCSIALKASKILPICCPALDISIYFPFPSGIDPHHQFLPDPFFLRIQDAVCWVIEMGETWWEIKQLFQLNLESLFTDFCKAPQQSIHKRGTYIVVIEASYITVLGRLICKFHFLTLRFYVKSKLAILGDLKLPFW